MFGLIVWIKNSEIANAADAPHMPTAEHERKPDFFGKPNI